MNLFDLFAKISLDTSEYERGLEGASGKASSFAGKIGSGLKTAAKVGAAAIGTASAAVGAFAKMSVSSYADYEQLVGGVETLFKDNANMVMDYADNAYKTAGMSANQYMETVTSFSASLLQGLGGDTESAAKIADQAIIDMSDNANKMGTSMEMIQNAYQGFAKQNYTMLDNLKLGYGGTAGEMARLINDSGVLGDSIEVTAKTVNSVSFDKMIEAIHVVQDNLGITGTTAKEASETISGSAGSMKAAWDNLVTGFVGGNANLSDLITNFVESVKTGVGNLIPAVSQALEGIGSAVQQLSPIITEQLPVLIQEIIPPLLDSAEVLLNALVEGIVAAAPNLAESAVSIVNSLITFITTNLPTLVEGALQIIVTLANGITESLPTLIPAIVEVALQIVDTLIDNIPLLTQAAIELQIGLANGLVEAIPIILEKLPQIIQSIIKALTKNIPLLVKGGVQLFVSLVKNLPAIIAGIVKAIPEIIMAILEGLGDLGGMLADLFSGAWEGIKSVFSGVGDFFGGIWSGIKSGFSSAGNSIKQSFSDSWEGAKNVWNATTDFFSGIGEGIKSTLSNAGEAMKNSLSDSWEGAKNVWNAASGFFSDVGDKAKSIMSSAGDSIKKTLSDSWEGTKSAWSAAKGFFSDLGESTKSTLSNAGDSIKGSFSDSWDGVKSAWGASKEFFGGVWENTKSTFSGAKETLGGFFGDAWSAIKNAFSSVKEFFGEVWEKITSSFDLSAALEWGKDLIQNFIDGILSKWDDLKETVKGVAGSIKEFIGFSEPKKGPLSNFHTYAPDMMQLFAQGIKENARIVQDQLDKSLDFDMGSMSLGFNEINMPSVSYSGANSTFLGGSRQSINTETVEKQPITIVVQLESGLELARQMIDDINRIQRFEGV